MPRYYYSHDDEYDALAARERDDDEYDRAFDARMEDEYDAMVMASVRAAAAAKRITESHTERRA